MSILNKMRQNDLQLFVLVLQCKKTGRLPSFAYLLIIFIFMLKFNSVESLPSEM